MDTLVTLPIMEVGDTEATTIPGVHTVTMVEVPTILDTTMVIITGTMTATTDMQPHINMVIWIAGILTDMVHPQTPPTTDPKGPPITIPGTGAEQPIPRVPAHPPREMAQVVSPAQLNVALQHVRAQHSVMQGPFPRPLMHNAPLLEPMQHY